MIVLPHSPGRPGPVAWPGIDRADVVHLQEPRDATIAARIAGLLRTVAAAPPEEPITLVAHSLGAVPVVLATSELDGRVARLVLVEPALYDIARGDPAIEQHIAAMTEARALLQAEGLEAYWRLVRPVMFGGSFDRDRWPEEYARAEAFTRYPVPWGHGIRSSVVRDIPTTVITGGWNAEYEAIAAELAAEGADHRVIPGHGHRPQDSPGFAALI